MLTFLHQHIIPSAYTLLPAEMASTSATAMLLAIAMQESKARSRRQLGGGPARGFWQFEQDGGVAGVITHPSTRPVIGRVIDTLQYPVRAEDCHRAIEHNDVLAACFARCLLWTLSEGLPTGPQSIDQGWRQYLEAWRPGAVANDPAPHRERWSGNFAQAWFMAGDGR